MQDEAVVAQLIKPYRVRSSALHHLDLRGAAARLDAAAAPRGVLLDQDLREVIRGGIVGASVCKMRGLWRQVARRRGAGTWRPRGAEIWGGDQGGDGYIGPRKWRGAWERDEGGGEEKV